MPRILIRLVIVSFVIFGLTFSLAYGNDSPTKRSKKKTPFVIKAKAWGPSQADVDGAKARVEASSALRSIVGRSRYRFLSFEYVEEAEKPGPSRPPTRFRAVYYDYTNDRTLVAQGDFAGKEDIVVQEAAFQPIASPDEFNEAVEILRSDASFGDSLKGGRLVAFEPMPDVTVL